MNCLTGIVLLMCIAVSVFGDICTNTPDYDKTDCGYIGIQPSECVNRGCCYIPSSVPNLPWCFQKHGASSTCFLLQDQLETPFSENELTEMKQYFLDNVNVDNVGAVVAAPDYNTPGGSYYYHWARDGALTMRVVQEIGANLSDYETALNNYVQWVVARHNENDPNNIDVRIEPKYTIPDGKPYTGAWCRPQNDGPGLRAITLMTYANTLIENGKEDYVRQYLWTGNNNDQYHGGAIKFDLDYVVSGWDSDTCDLWEEIRSSDLFWNKITMKKAMSMGSDFARRMGDTNSANLYHSTRSRINATLFNDHWNGEFLREDNSRTRDSSVIIGLNDGFDDDGFLSPTSYEVASTINSYNKMFCQEYSINLEDTQNNVPGVLYGRYQGDVYAGGNPWVLSTGALASLLYRGAKQVLSEGAPDDRAMQMWATTFNLGSGSSLPTSKQELANVFAAAGDSVLLRIQHHVKNDNGHLAEQLNRDTGVHMAANDLTWSYAEVLTAVRHRDEYLTQSAMYQYGSFYPIYDALKKAASFISSTYSNF